VSATFDLVTFDSPDTNRLAGFWSAAIGLHEIEREDGDRWIVLADGAGQRRIGIQRGRHRPGSVHLDLACRPDEFDVELDRMIACGAIELSPPRREPYGAIVNLADPDGNAFDLCAYR
jgi:predicted enzyme related to lactoylglutathione lyase